ncbi:MAG TPA: amidase [Ktedonobacterales bacterium]|nr:amidase [Ktedonobacterales bacterium]
MAEAIERSVTTANEGTADTDLTRLSASELAQRIRAGELTSQQVVEAHIRRIEAVNPRINALVFPLFDQARAEAKAADEAQAQGKPLPPLHGVPITIKDQFLVKGTPSTWGLLNQANHRAEDDGPLVKRLRAAGAIILGKTNIPQLLYYPEADNPVYGRCNNPWNLDRVPGGSSGGEGAIIAAGGSPLGLGGDIGGSLRVPAHFCGITTLKPTTALLSNKDNPDHLGITGQEAIVSQQGAMARSVADVALGLRLLSAPGQEVFDPTIPPVQWREPEKVDVGKVRIAMYTDDGFITASPAIRRATREAADALRAQGIVVEEWTPPDVHEGMALFVGLLGADGGAWAKRLLAGDKPTRPIAGLLQIVNLPGFLRPTVRGLMGMLGQRRLANTMRSLNPLSADQLWQLVARRTHYRRRFLAAMDAGRYDAIICPPYPVPALTHGASYYLTTAGSYTMLYNLLGMPAGVVPATRVRAGEESDRPDSKDWVEKAAKQVEMNSAGLPVGVQVVARHWREDVALAIMYALEAHFRQQPDYPARPEL